MAIGDNGGVYECVLVDLNTQRDLCAVDGAYPVQNHQALIAALRRVVAWTKRNHAPVVSSIESHRLWELSDCPPPAECCIDGTEGQRKVDFTVFRLCARIEVDNTLSIPIDLFKRYQQVIFRKRSGDLLENPKADRFLTQLPTQEFILFGTGIEDSVKSLALALLARDKRVTVVVDACGYWNKATAEHALRQMVAKGARLITVDELRTRKLDRSRRYPNGAAGAGKGNGVGRSGRRTSGQRVGEARKIVGRKPGKPLRPTSARPKSPAPRDRK